jgi:hypothetical protein
MVGHNITIRCMAAILFLAATSPAFATRAPRRAAIGSASAEVSDSQPTTQTPPAPLSNAVVQGYGCLGTGGMMTALGAFAGDSQLVLVFAGGSVVPATPLGLALAVTGTVFASFCAIGALAAPAIVHVWQEYYPDTELAPTPAG